MFGIADVALVQERIGDDGIEAPALRLFDAARARDEGSAGAGASQGRGHVSAAQCEAGEFHRDMATQLGGQATQSADGHQGVLGRLEVAAGHFDERAHHHRFRPRRGVGVEAAHGERLLEVDGGLVEVALHQRDLTERVHDRRGARVHGSECTAHHHARPLEQRTRRVGVLGSQRVMPQCDPCRRHSHVLLAMCVLEQVDGLLQGTARGLASARNLEQLGTRAQ